MLGAGSMEHGNRIGTQLGTLNLKLAAGSLGQGGWSRETGSARNLELETWNLELET